MCEINDCRKVINRFWVREESSGHNFLVCTQHLPSAIKLLDYPARRITVKERVVNKDENNFEWITWK